MGSLEYWFGTGDGVPTTWTSVADLDLDADGEFDAVRLDFDGDGLFDDAMWDSDGDGTADRSVLDVGETARYFADPERTGVWGRQVTGTAQSAVPAPAPQFPEPPDPAGWRTVDYDGDGAADDALVDFDGDGEPDVVLVSTRETSRYDTVLVAEEEPGRMSVQLGDTDGDGRLDTVRRDGR
ncbi:VCBS repeat-containing protein [Prescottella defluvii]|uniref:hypothetical protein n=1 Tax=Prescottella defluvii TaxID=1323361 RepID=UPI0004F267EC|nr:hypothetical protein [Prescottella defluvii]